jgi:Spherulation-specific family 4.
MTDRSRVLIPSWFATIKNASDAGLKPLGYVGTDGGTKPIEVVKAEIDSWFNTSDVKGIYLGNSANPNGGGFATDPKSEAYYKEIANYIKSKGGFAAINGFGTPNQDYMGVFDLQNAAEGYKSNYDQRPPVADWMKNYDPDNFSAILLGVDRNQIGSTENRLLNDGFGYISVAPDYGIETSDEEAYWRDARDGLDGRIDGVIPR